MTPITIKFTPGEWDILSDRLYLADAIAEALTDETGDKRLHLTYQGRAQIMALNGSPVRLNDQRDIDVLVDAVEGSTMPARLRDTINYGEADEKRAARAQMRHFKNIEAKLAAAGIEAHFPKR